MTNVKIVGKNNNKTLEVMNKILNTNMTTKILHITNILYL